MKIRMIKKILKPENPTLDIVVVSSYVSVVGSGVVSVVVSVVWAPKLIIDEPLLNRIMSTNIKLP